MGRSQRYFRALAKARMVAAAAHFEFTAKGRLMKATLRWCTALGLMAVLVLLTMLATAHYVRAQAQRDAKAHTPFYITRVYTGADGLAHAEDIEANFASNGAFQMLPVTGAELHRAEPGNVGDWHRGPRRQYVITLTGRAEIEVAGGKKIISDPGHIDLIEDLTGKGHITRVLGNEERVTLWLPTVDQTVSTNPSH